MRRWMRYFIIYVVVAFAGLSSFQGTDVSKLAPIEVIWLGTKGNLVSLETDTGDMGQGLDVQKALEDMKSAASGNIFLETAEYLVVEQGNEALLPQIYEALRPACKVCIARKKPNLQDAAAFLAAHEPKLTLQQLRAMPQDLPVLKEWNGRFDLIAQ